MKQVDCIEFLDDATGCGISISIYQKDDAMVLIDLQVAEKPAAVVSLPRDIARRFADSVDRALL